MLKFSRIFLISTVLIALSLPARDIDLNTMAAYAAKEGKHLLVWLHKTDCGYCETMREFTLADDRIKPLLKRDFVFVHINVYDRDDVTFQDFRGDGRAFAKKVGYNFYPSSLFLDKNAEIVFAAPGYIGENDFLSMLKFVAMRAYEKQEYNRFLKQEKQ